MVVSFRGGWFHLRPLHNTQSLVEFRTGSVSHLFLYLVPDRHLQALGGEQQGTWD
jgi:hypothetical protein